MTLETRTQECLSLILWYACHVGWHLLPCNNQVCRFLPEWEVGVLAGKFLLHFFSSSNEQGNEFKIIIACACSADVDGAHNAGYFRTRTTTALFGGLVEGAKQVFGTIRRNVDGLLHWLVAWSVVL